jgi:hypothetical protein
LVFLVPYVGSYAYLSRRGMREAEAFQRQGFLYFSLHEQGTTPEAAVARHYRLVRFYAPINLADQFLFGAKGPVRGMTLSLSK